MQPKNGTRKKSALYRLSCRQGIETIDLDQIVDYSNIRLLNTKLSFDEDRSKKVPRGLDARIRLSYCNMRTCHKWYNIFLKNVL